MSAVPRHVQEAVIAAENRSFRTDSGISPKAITRAALATLTGGDPQGGSTITQQYVKNALLSPEHSLARKAREALIAIKLDRTRTKDEILEGISTPCTSGGVPPGSSPPRATTSAWTRGA